MPAGDSSEDSVRIRVNLPREGGREAATDGGLLERGVRSALERGSVAEGEISVTLVDDAAIRSLNRRYLGRDRPTDVLAFPLFQEGEPVLGDVYVGVDQARRQAEELGIPVDEELLRLAVHGTLHVLGLDHPEGEERQESEMFRIQEALVAEVLGLRSDPGAAEGGGPASGDADGGGRSGATAYRGEAPA